MDFKAFFTPAVVAANWTEVASNRFPYLGVGLFGNKKKSGLDLSWIKGSKGLPISLMPSTFDAKATFRDRIGVSKMETEMPFFREGVKIKEKDRQDLLRANDSNDPYVQATLDRVFDDVNELIDAADVVPERMRMQLLFAEDGNVGIAIKANGVDYTYNYDQNGEWKTNNYTALTGEDLWTAPETADPLVALKTAKDAVAARTGSNDVYAVMNSYTFNLLSKIKSIKNRYLTMNGMSLGYLTDAEVRNVIKSTTNLEPIVYDKMYRDEDKAVHKFVPDGYVALIPEGELGSTWYGTTPEEADLIGSNTAEVAIVNTGVAITRIIEEHPVNINTFASEIVLPSYERMDEVALIKVVA